MCLKTKGNGFSAILTTTNANTDRQNTPGQSGPLRSDMMGTEHDSSASIIPTSDQYGNLGRKVLVNRPSELIRTSEFPLCSKHFCYR